jgi:hypothetical protein
MDKAHPRAEKVKHLYELCKAYTSIGYSDLQYLGRLLKKKRKNTMREKKEMSLIIHFQKW